MPTAYIKKLAKLNHTTVNKIEKFWAQAKEIAKSEGNGKAWGLITTIFQNKLKKEGYKVEAISYDNINSPESTKKFYEDLETELKKYRESKVVSDTDELDDADLGLNVDPKEYHKQKSLQMSLQSKLDMIKNDINKETKQNIDELKKVAKKLNKTNRRKWTNDNNGDKWLNYKGPVNEDVIVEAFADGHYNNSNESYYKDRPDVLSFKNSSIFKTYQRLLKNKPVILYRGLHFKDDSDLKNWIPFLKYNLMDRNSWTTSIGKARIYSKIGSPKCSIVLKIECTLDKTNLPLSAWLEGNWFAEDNKEVNLKKSFEVEDISIVDYKGDISNLVEHFNKTAASTITAFKEETREVDDRKFIFKRLSLSDCVKQIKDLFDDYFNFGKKDLEYYEKLYNTKVDESTASDLLPSDDFTVYIEYNDGSNWYSVADPKLKDLKLTGIKNCIIEYPAYTAYFGKDCRIERFDDAKDSPYVIKCGAKMNKYSYKGEIITASSKEEAIKKIVAYKFGNRTVEDVKKYLKHYSPIEEEASNLSLYKKEIIRLLKADGQVRMLSDKYKLNCLCKLCYEAKVSCYDAFRYISNNY